MNLICWNCRGTAVPGFAGLVKDMKREFSASFIALMETHTSGALANKIAKRIGFDNYFIKDARGQAGGIWLLWDNNNWNIRIVSDSNQFVHVQVLPSDAEPWFLTIVYGSPHYAPRQDLWDDIQTLHDDIDGAWILIGDFNCVIKDSERSGPPLKRDQVCESGFITTIDSCHLIDLGYKGDCFTWSGGGTRKRLDRAVCNLDWRLRFNDSDITHLPKLKSDHTPLLLSFDQRIVENRGRRPFRFEAIWLTHPSFNQLIAYNW